MAIYDVNAAIQKPNIVNAMQQGFMFGSQQRQIREQREREAKVNALAPGVIGGDPNAYAEAAAIDPQRAQQFQQAGDVNLRRMKGAVEFINRARQSGNPQAVNAALRAAKPYLSQYANGAVIPDEWTPEMEQGWPGFEAKVAMLGGQGEAAEPAGFRQAHLTAIAAGYQPGTPEYQKAMQVAAGTAPRAIPPGFTTRSYRDANGQEVVELVQVRGEGTGQAVPAPQMPAQAPQQSMAASGGDPQMDALAQAANAMIKAGIPPEQVDAFLMQTAQASPNVQVNPPGMMPMGNAQPQLPPINELGGGPVAPLRGSGRGQTDADRARAEAMKAAAVERARIQTQLSMAPMQAEADAAREGAVTEARGSAEARAKRLAELPKVLAQSDQTISLIDAAINHPGRATATGASSRLDPRNFLPGTAATDFTVLLDQLKGKAFLEAFQSLKGGGAITQVEGTKAEQAIARLNTAQSDEAFVEALRELQQIARDAKAKAVRMAQEGAPMPESAQDDDEALIGKYL